VLTDGDLWSLARAAFVLDQAGAGAAMRAEGELPVAEVWQVLDARASGGRNRRRLQMTLPALGWAGLAAALELDAAGRETPCGRRILMAGEVDQVTTDELPRDELLAEGPVGRLGQVAGYTCAPRQLMFVFG
jgi:hypothetical protein